MTWVLAAIAIVLALAGLKAFVRWADAKSDQVIKKFVDDANKEKPDA